MADKFPEKAYESMFIHELLVHFTKPGTAPFYIPSQVEESKLGYDFCFIDSSGNQINRKVMLIQFKRSEEYAKKTTLHHFKFDIYRRKKTPNTRNPFCQHNKLCLYNTKGPKMAGVYCAPRFVTYKDLYDKVINSSVIADSALFTPTRFLFSGSHHVSFDDKDAVQCSKEGETIAQSSFEEILQRLEPISKEEFGRILSEEKESYKKILQDIKEENVDKNNTELSTNNLYYLFI